MRKETELSKIALAADGVHDTAHDAAVACFLVTFFGKVFFKTLEEDSVLDSAIDLSKLLKTFKQTVMKKLAFEYKGEIPKQDVQNIHNVCEYIQERCHEDIDDAFDHIKFYLHSSQAVRTYAFPLKRVFYCIFNVLFDSSHHYFQIEEPSQQLKQQERLYHLYLSVKGLYEYDCALGGSPQKWKICHTGVRHTFMDVLQFSTLYL